MSQSFYIVDDDKGVCKMLSNIIGDHELGEVLGWAVDGLRARGEIPALRPDIVLIDLLLPGIDGIALVGELRTACPGTSFVMVSQVTSKDMVSKAYTAGMDFYISKPINVVEVVSVIRRVQDNMRLQGIIRSLQVVIGGAEEIRPAQDMRRQSEDDLRARITGVLTRLGILGESGSKDIVEMCLLYLRSDKGGPEGKPRLNDLHAALVEQYAREYGMQVNAATIEQRIRRAIAKALNNVASLGLEDYSNEFFVSFGGAFFDFAEVRKQMNYLRGSSGVQGKINARKFFEGMAAYLQQR